MRIGVKTINTFFLSFYYMFHGSLTNTFKIIFTFKQTFHFDSIIENGKKYKLNKLIPSYSK